MIKFLIYALMITCIGYVAADNGSVSLKKHMTERLQDLD